MCTLVKKKIEIHAYEETSGSLRKTHEIRKTTWILKSLHQSKLNVKICVFINSLKCPYITICCLCDVGCIDLGYPELPG